jgi:hypothetical protein
VEKVGEKAKKSVSSLKLVSALKNVRNVYEAQLKGIQYCPEFGISPL